MKAKVKYKDPEFEPIELVIKLESKDEVNEFNTLFDTSCIVENLVHIDAGLISSRLMETDDPATCAKAFADKIANHSTIKVRFK